MTCPMIQIERKENYAFNVNSITPYSNSAKQTFAARKPTIKPFFCNHLWRFLLDNFLSFGIIRLTGKVSYSGDQYHGRLWRCKIGSTWSKWHTKYPSRRCCRQAILRQRVFRPSGFATSQVRDASTGAARWRTSFKGDLPHFLSPVFMRVFPCSLLRLQYSY